MLSRCDDAVFFTSLGLTELVVLFHCNRDFAMVEGFNPRSRCTQTIMPGARRCDFR
jgi:L-2-amino-thiazoline-4-carboxylic acid hydrolase